MKSTDATRLSIVLIGYVHGRGGIQTHTRFLAEGLRERGHEVHIFSPPPMAEHGHSDESDGVHVYSGLRDLARAIRGARPSVAVVVGTGWKSMAGVLAAGGDCRKVFFEVMSGARPSFLDPRMLVRVGFDAIVGQGSPVTRRFVREFGWDGPAETIPALPEPLERQFTIPERALRPVSDGIRFVYFGRLAPPKNVGLLIEEFDRFANDRATLDIWGGGSDAGRLSELIAERDLQDRIRLRGRYPEGQAYIELLQGYDLLLLPTIAEEGAPLVLLEAMACGLPFVANGMGGIPDYANPDSLITDGTIADFVPAVQQMAGRLEQADVDPARLQLHYRENFGFEKLVDRWDDFLLRTAGRP
ncbi:glycosyltransferase family 4 protein [Erythrobacter sp. THAF29]|uniref:glycosyltransferase family 4 protein n=1 Tax=Erythrobacter sp. THAF29 TaxID=2587851 RepID=UPI0012A9B0FE|nr:glycosyltransferase family 4 protein [Erythrobacter sp. THAF29]QFT76316.1 GDP-mannose-dependent alpha-(1-6)-phosphatidylinositol monomannoside mannosyltransferase [Erythrobacter sp. THAF29]